jgi:DNA polymerase-4/protein ImuB
MKILCILLPHFPLRCEIRRHPDLQSSSIIITHAEGSQKLVLDYSPELEGLQRNMPLQQALSRHGTAGLIQADIPYYWSVFNTILNSLERKSPLVEGFNLGQAYLGLDGLQLIYPDDHALVDAVREVIPVTFAASMGIAQGKFPAYLAALCNSTESCQVLTDNPDSMETFLRDIPCDVLPISTKSKDKLRDFGIRTLGQAAVLPIGPLLSQFGMEGRLISELARGYDSTPLYPRFMEENIEEDAMLPSVTVSLEALLIAVEALFSRVFARDSLKGRGIRSVALWTRGWTSEYWERVIRFKEPAVDIKGVISRIKPIMEAFPQPCPVEQIGLKITGLGYRNGRQRSLFSEIRAREHLLDDIKQLDLRMGSPQVFKIKEVEPWSRIPERRYAMVPLSQ